VTHRSPQRAIDFSRFVFAGAALVLLAMVVLPVGWLVATSLSGPHGPTLSNYVTLFTDPTMVQPFLITLESSAAVAILCVVVAVPMGWCVARTDMPLRRLVRVLVMASLVTPPFLGAIAWELLAAPNTGFLNQVARAVFQLDRSVHPFNIYTVAGLTFVNFLYTFPYAFTFVANALERIPADFEDASAILGARSWETLRRVTLPLILPAILAGGLIAFLQSMTVFGSAAILGRAARARARGDASRGARHRRRDRGRRDRAREGGVRCGRGHGAGTRRLHQRSGVVRRAARPGGADGPRPRRSGVVRRPRTALDFGQLELR
jgi:iron(III) transport system permease protein